MIIIRNSEHLLTLTLAKIEKPHSQTKACVTLFYPTETLEGGRWQLSNCYIHWDVIVGLLTEEAMSKPEQCNPRTPQRAVDA